MRRALAILKYVPAVLCGLVTAVWIASWFGWYDVYPAENTVITVKYGGVELHRYRDYTNNAWAEPRGRNVGLLSMGWLGDFDYATREQHVGRNQWCSEHHFRMPIPVFFPVLLPVAVGCFTRFRFPLWSYFAWTALVAAELAYYLR